MAPGAAPTPEGKVPVKLTLPGTSPSGFTGPHCGRCPLEVDTYCDIGFFAVGGAGIGTPTAVGLHRRWSLANYFQNAELTTSTPPFATIWKSRSWEMARGSSGKIFLLLPHLDFSTVATC